jgi:hypothetical protein
MRQQQAAERRYLDGVAHGSCHIVRDTEQRQRQWAYGIVSPFDRSEFCRLIGQGICAMLSRITLFDGLLIAAFDGLSSSSSRLP